MAEQTPKRTIVVSVTSSDHSQWAFEWYMKNLHRSDDNVILFYCQEPLEEPADPYSSHTPAWKKKVKNHEEEQQHLIDVYKEKCNNFVQSAKIKIETHHRPGEHILTFSAKNNAAYIVLGKRSLSTIRRTLLGGVSDHVVAHSKIPVVVVPAKELEHHH